MSQRLYTAHMTGGKPFSLQLPNNPTHDHDGVLSVVSLILTEVEVQGLVGACTLNGCFLKISQVIGQSGEQSRLRSLLLLEGAEEYLDGLDFIEGVIPDGDVRRHGEDEDQ